MELRGKGALVTGGAKRVGRAIALGLAARGCNVAITYRSSDREAAATVRELRKRRVKALAVRADQRDPWQIRRAVKAAEAGLGRLDLLVNNASSFYPTPWEKVTPEAWSDLLDTNLAGPWWFAQAAARAMRRGGKIVNIIDVSVFSPWTDYLPYSAAKGGLFTLTLGLAKALAPKIQVNGIAPGPILFPPGMPASEKRAAVDRTLLKRSGSPQDIVDAVLYFAEGGDFVTGVVLPVDGGRRLA